jgi:hypothetical protein
MVSSLPPGEMTNRSVVISFPSSWFDPSLDRMIVDPLRKDGVFTVLRISGPLIRMFLAVELVEWVDGHERRKGAVWQNNLELLS